MILFSLPGVLRKPGVATSQKAETGFVLGGFFSPRRETHRLVGLHLEGSWSFFSVDG